MSATPAGPRGLAEALRAMGATLGEIVRVRGALLGLEAREELQRRQHMLVLAVAGAVLLHMALLLVSLLVVAAFWDGNRLLAIGGMAVFYAACAGVAVMRLRHQVATSPEPFAASLRELERDFAAMGPPR
jgi:uncharacterized membrane protein YqjE